MQPIQPMQPMQSRWTRRFALTLVGVALGCDAGVADDALRGVGAKSTDEDTAVHAGTSTTNPDCLIWDIVGDGVSIGPADDGVLLWRLDETGTQISDRYGQLLCTIEEFDGPDHLVLQRAPDGPVVATQWHYAAYVGDVSTVPPDILPNVADYQVIKDVHVLDRATNTKVATTTGHLAWASTKRKLLISGLIMGVCGSEGLPSNAGAALAP